MGKPPHPSQNASAPSSIEQPDIKCHNREFYVPEVPDDYPYQMEKSKSSTNISIPFYEFRGNGPPPTDIGNPGDVYLQIGAENLTLYAKMRSGWKIWNPLPMWGSMLPPASELIAHPDSDNLKRYLWCDGYQLGWYALSGVRGKRSRMRQDGMYRTKGGLTEEPNSTVVATEVIRRMLDGQETGKVRILGRSRKRPSSSLKGGETAPRKRAKTQTHRTPIIKSDDSEDKPLSWKIKFTPCYYPGESMAQHHSNSTAPGVSKNSANAPLFKAEEIDPPDVGGIQESQRMKDLIEEKNLYLEENQRLKERVLQLTSQTNRLRDEITRRSSVDLGTSSDNFQTLAEVLNPIINGNGDTLQTLGIGTWQY